MQNEISQLISAAAFAANKHGEQRRKDKRKSPYINHPLAVACLLAVDGDVQDVELLVAALLHDTVEDTATSSDEIAELFGGNVRSLVGEVTDDKSLPKQRRKELQVYRAKAQFNVQQMERHDGASSSNHFPHVRRKAELDSSRTEHWLSAAKNAGKRGSRYGRRRRRLAT